MTTDNLNPNPRLAEFLVREQAAAMGPLMLLDVGCSGGLHYVWDRFGDSLHAVAFDPLVLEIERLRRESPRKNVVYEAAFVGAPHYADLFPHAVKQTSPDTNFRDRTSAMRANGSYQNYEREHFNNGQPLQFSETRLSLDGYCASHGIQAADFIKVDTDGHDYEVLLGADRLLSEGVLGVSVEVMFQGPVHEHANLFCNIDRYLRGKGFTLCDMEAFRYSRAALPMPFYYDLPAQTDRGALLWGEAVYFRDLANPSYAQHWNYPLTQAALLKLAALYDVFGLSDCAAELIRNRPEMFAGFAAQLLNLMVPSMTVGDMSYAEYIRLFDVNPQMWYPQAKLFGSK